jgi:hypothetical protein
VFVFSRDRLRAAIVSSLLIAPAAPAALVAQSKPAPVPRLSEAQQIASAVLALPGQVRGDARVRG